MTRNPARASVSLRESNSLVLRLTERMLYIGLVVRIQPKEAGAPFLAAGPLTVGRAYGSACPMLTRIRWRHFPASCIPVNALLRTFPVSGDIDRASVANFLKARRFEKGRQQLGAALTCPVIGGSLASESPVSSLIERAAKCTVQLCLSLIFLRRWAASRAREQCKRGLRRSVRHKLPGTAPHSGHEYSIAAFALA